MSFTFTLIGSEIPSLKSPSKIDCLSRRIYNVPLSSTYCFMFDLRIALSPNPNRFAMFNASSDAIDLLLIIVSTLHIGFPMLLGGVDKVGSKLFQTDPSGACWSYKAFAIGAGGESVREILEQEYHEDMKLEEGISLAIKCLSEVIEGQLDSEKVRIAIIPVDTRTFTWISGEELDKHLEKAIE